MPSQTNTDKAPHWVASMACDEKTGRVHLTIPEFGGQVDASLALGQDDWLSKWLAGREGVEQTWTTTWDIRDRPLAESLADQLVRDFGAERLDSDEYDRAWKELHSFVWDRVVFRR